MAEKLSGVNGKLIVWARKRLNMSQEEAATAIGVELQTYINWENGNDYPTYAKLKKVSSVFRRPTAIFFFPEIPDIPNVQGDLRTLPNVVVDSFSKNIIVQFEKAKAYQLSLHELYPGKTSILKDRKAFPNDLEELAYYIRDLLQFPIEVQKGRKSEKVVFEILRDKLYEQGIYVFKDAFKDDSVSGLCLFDENYPVIIINNSMSFARQLFTLFHELYHLLSETGGAEIIRDDYYSYLDSEQTRIEKNCDTFANYFLIPNDDFKFELEKNPITVENKDQRIIDLSKLYSVSKEAIMYKLLDNGLITDEEYSSLKEFFYGDAIRRQKKNTDKKSKGNHYYTLMSYLGPKYAGDVFNLYFSGKIDSVRAGEMLHSKVDQLPKLESVLFRGVG